MFKKSTRKNKKYMVNYGDKWIHFGDKRYQHFMDSTPLKLYSHMDHNDYERRKNYRDRARGITNKYGELTYDNPNYANYWSYNYLW